MKMQGSRSHGGGNSGSAQSANSWSCRENFPATGELFCYCGIPAPVKTSRTPKNNGRRFCSCENFKVWVFFFNWLNLFKMGFFQLVLLLCMNCSEFERICCVCFVVCHCRKFDSFDPEEKTFKVIFTLQLQPKECSVEILFYLEMYIKS